MHIYPVHDEKARVGTVIVANQFNKDDTIINAFSKSIKNTYIAVSIDGVRIASNLGQRATGEYIGSLSPIKKEDYQKNGDYVFGEQYFPKLSENHVFLDKYLYNDKKEPIATIGIGMPTDRFRNIMLERIKYIIALTVLILITMIIVGGKTAKRMIQPILKLIDDMKQYGELDIQKIDKRTLHGNEVIVLQEIFKQLIETLDLKETERKDYLKKVLERREEIKQLADELKNNNECLELVVQERTKELQLIIQELKETDKAKLTFIANMSHELRTPLNVINGSAELLKEGVWGSLNERQLKYINNIYNSGNHLLELINDILDISKMNIGKILINPEWFYVEEVIKRSVYEMNVMAQSKNIKVDVYMPRGDFKVHIDLHKFLQIIYNLLSNSLKFTKENGHIFITVTPGGGLFELRIKDTGIGIDQENIERVFKEFEQVENSYCRQFGGTGLGLPIVKKLVEFHEGVVHLKSKIGEGTEVVVILPIDVEKHFNYRNGREENEDER